MIVSMVLQAVYNIVDTVFVVNMGEGGIEGNLALTYAFPDIRRTAFQCENAKKLEKPLFCSQKSAVIKFPCIIT